MGFARRRRDDLASFFRMMPGDDPILRIATEVGYASEQALSKAFARRYAAAPGRYRRQHRGTQCACEARDAIRAVHGSGHIPADREIGPTDPSYEA